MGRYAKRQSPVGARRNLAVGPVEPISRRKLLDAVNQRPGGGNVVQREIAIETLQAEAAINLRVDEQRLELGAEEEVFTETRDVERFDSHAVAGQNQAFS